jgi:hypothetical protein
MWNPGRIPTKFSELDGRVTDFSKSKKSCKNNETYDADLHQLAT